MRALRTRACSLNASLRTTLRFFHVGDVAPLEKLLSSMSSAAFKAVSSVASSWFSPSSAEVGVAREDSPTGPLVESVVAATAAGMQQPLHRPKPSDDVECSCSKGSM